jgi:hypothetical protein
MKPESQRIAIAEACGWKNLCWYRVDVNEEILIGNSPKDTHPYSSPVPDYLNDLNAMHEAERVIPENLRGAYTTTLHIFSSHYADEREWLAIHSTAAQRAEALLRTINKWNHLQ